MRSSEYCSNLSRSETNGWKKSNCWISNILLEHDGKWVSWTCKSVKFCKYANSRISFTFSILLCERFNFCNFGVCTTSLNNIRNNLTNKMPANFTSLLWLKFNSVKLENKYKSLGTWPSFRYPKFKYDIWFTRCGEKSFKMSKYCNTYMRNLIQCVIVISGKRGCRSWSRHACFFYAELAKEV